MCSPSALRQGLEGRGRRGMEGKCPPSPLLTQEQREQVRTWPRSRWHRPSQAGSESLMESFSSRIIKQQMSCGEDTCLHHQEEGKQLETPGQIQRAEREQTSGCARSRCGGVRAAEDVWAEGFHLPIRPGGTAHPQDPVPSWHTQPWCKGRAQLQATAGGKMEQGLCLTWETEHQKLTCRRQTF